MIKFFWAVVGLTTLVFSGNILHLRAWDQKKTSFPSISPRDHPAERLISPLPQTSVAIYCKCW